MNTNNVTDNQKIVLKNEFLNIFRPYYYIKTIACVRSFNINHNYVESISTKNIIWAVLANCVMAVMYYTIVMYTTKAYSTAPFLKIYYATYFQYLINFLVVSIVNLYNSKLSVRLIAILNEINSLDSQEEWMNFKIMSWLSCIVLVTYNVAIVFVKLYFDEPSTFGRGFFILVSLVFHLEITQATIIILILNRKIAKCVEDIKYVDFGNDDCDDVRIDSEVELDYIYNVFKLVINAWDLLKKHIQIHILLHFVTSFAQTLLYVEVLIIWSGMHIEREVVLSYAMAVLLWIFKVFLVEVGFCLTCDVFYSQIARGDAIALLRATNDVQSKNILKNIHRLIHKQFRKLSPCGLFTIDAALLINFVQLVATYTIVLLQFAFL